LRSGTPTLTKHSEDPFDIPNFLHRPSWSEADSGLKWDLPHEATQPTAQAVPLEQQGETENEGAEHGLQRRLGDECDAQRALLRRPSGMSGLNSFEPRPKLAVISEPPANSRSRVVSKSRHVKYWLFAVFTTAAIAPPMGADNTLPGGEDRNLALVAAPRQPLPEAEATNAPAAPSDDENQLSQTNWSERASQLKVVLPTIVASSEPSATPDARSAATLPRAAGDANPTLVATENAAPQTSAQTSAHDNAVQGVSEKEILFGMAAPFSGASRELGRQMQIGVETAFNQINDAGGENGRLLRLMTADDGYEPTRTADVMKLLYDKDQVFGFVGNVGTPTAAVALPFALDHHALFFGAFTGAGLLRHDPPDRYVFNYRASYAEETNAVVNYLVKVRRIQPKEIVVFAQQDSYGDSGYAGVQKAVRALPGDNPDIVRLNYKRNTVDVQDAVNALRAFRGQIKAVVMVASYRAAAKFIEKTRDLYPSMIYTNVSFVGSTALADELMLLGPRYAAGTIVTQVVPAINSYATIVLKYKEALAKYFPGEPPDYVSFEGYIDGNILAEAVKRVGRDINMEKLVDELERMHDFDLGLGTPVTFSSNEHQGSHKVWARNWTTLATISPSIWIGSPREETAENRLAGLSPSPPVARDARGPQSYQGAIPVRRVGWPAMTAGHSTP
jgi:branched-chain amino acid transport system substrate-binding protein